MPFVRINIKRCVQDSEEYGSTEEHMVSRVFFSIEVDGVPKGNYYSDIKHVVGRANSSADMEVSRPHGYRGPYDHYIFSDAVAGYYCKLVSLMGATFSFGGVTNIRVRNNSFITPYHFQFDAEGPAAN